MLDHAIYSSSRQEIERNLLYAKLVLWGCGLNLGRQTTMIRHWKTFPTIIAFGCCWLVLQSTVAVGEDGIMMMAMTMQEFCGDSNLKQIETYMNSLRFTELNYQNMSEVNILSNNATGYQCHCNFLGTVVECRLWTSQNCDHRYDAWCQEIVVTDILHFQNTTSPDDASSSLVVSHPGWIETCSYPLSNNYDDRIKYDPVQYPLLDYNHSSPFLCERLVLSSSSSSDGSSGTVRLESCAVTWTYEDYCKICPEGTGTYMTDVGENFFSKNRCQNENTTDGLLSTASLLYQYHLNVQPIQVILKDSELDNTTAIACEDLTADEYCEDLSSVEASFTESLSNLFSFSDLNEVKDGYKCTCDRSTGKGDKVIVGVVCHAQYVLEDWETGEKMEYTDTQQMVLQQREVIKRIPSYVFFWFVSLVQQYLTPAFLYLL